MDSSSSLELERAEAHTCTSTEPSQVLLPNSSLREDVSQLPRPATVTVSSDLVEDLLVQLMLRLNPLRSFIGAHMDQQQLLKLCLHMSAVTLESLRKVPGVSVDEKLPPPRCNTWKAAVLLQSSLMNKFGTSIQVRKQLVRKDPELLNFIPRHIIEAVLTKYKDESESTPTEAPSEESLLFSQFLPESVKEEMFEQHGSWIRRTKVFQRAFPRITDEDVLEYQRHISKPRLSNRDVVWVDKKYFVADFYEEVNTAADISSLLHRPPADLKGDQGLVSTTEDKYLQSVSSLKPPQLCPLQLVAGNCDIVKENMITDRALVKEFTIQRVLVELFKDWEDETFKDQLVEHIHLLVTKEAKKYEKNRVFFKNLKGLEDPKEELKLSQEVCRSLKATWLTREMLLEDVGIALLGCSLIATEIMNHLKPTVSFAADTKPGDETLYNINIPLKREEVEPKRELTRLELQLQKERAKAREEVFSFLAEPEPTPTEKVKKKKNRFFSWLRKVVRWRKV